jgi:hypothetical protein
MKLEPQDISDIKVAAAMRNLIQSEGWHHFARIISTHIATKEKEVLEPYRIAREKDHQLTKGDYREVQTENKGALYALRLALNTPRAIIEAAEDILEKIPPEQRHVIEES